MIISDFFDQLATHFNSELPFVGYRKPNEKKLQAFLQTSDELNTISDYTEKGFVMAPFNDEEPSVLIPLEQSKSISTLYSFDSSNELPEKTHNSDLSASEHIALVAKGVNIINKGSLDKVVISRKEVVSITETNPITIFKRLLQSYPTAFVYCWYHPKVGLWLGATPETLLSVANNRLSTMSLAGTQEYKDSLDVVWGNKEQVEQQFVTDYIVENLQDSLSNISVSEPETIKAGNLLHLKSTITGKINETGLKDIIKKLHPTPAVCGVPKQEAKAFLLQNEPYNRAFYTGFLGELNMTQKSTRNTNRRNVENNAYATVKTTTKLFVNLRCMQWFNNDTVHLYLGGGITKDSNPEAEWLETVAKARVMKKVLQ
ncbi:chorismate-binding protein [Corallibacter vietnamensis]|uniref:Chorismate-binding protein n=1 Tax=Corallibacter vietnamensis TaxID=904130 RepID=A0ABP7HEY8_9FLAO